jgi:formyltetrahydrofolate synthetase
LDPTHGAVGTDVTITGTGFGADKGTVKFGDTAATDIESWADAKIVVKVPAEAKTAEVVVTAGGKEGKDQKIGTFTVDAAAKPGLNPTHGAVGTDVTITGTGFGADKGTVQFGGIAATDITKWADTKIVVIVPARAKSGNVVVEVRGKGRIVGTFSIR